MGKERSAPPDTDPLVSHGFFEFSNRPVRDRGWGVLYLVFVAATLAGGVYAAVHRSPEFASSLNSDVMGDPSTCPAHRGRSLLQREEDHQSLGEMIRSFAFVMLATTVAPLVVGVAFVWTFKHHAVAMVKLTVRIQVAIPLMVGIVLLVSGQIVPGAVLLGMAALSALAFYLWRNELELCGRLLGVAGSGLNDNPGLLVFAVLALLAVACLWVPLVSFLGLSYANGSIRPNPAAALNGPTCRDAQGQQVPCCVWQADPWVPFYASLNIVSTMWTVFLSGEIRRYVLSATIAQWYFSPPGASMVGSTKRSVGLALGPSFGTCAFGSAILTLVQLVRNAMERARQSRDGDNILFCLVSCVMECFMQLVEFLTKFATVRAAITGEAFLSAGRSVTDLLARNFLKAYAVWWIPPLVLQTAAFLISAAWGCLVYGLGWLLWHNSHQHGYEALLGIMSFLLAWVVQSFFASVLLNIVDVVFVCYAMDRDTQAVTRPEVHDVMAQVPVGVAVENPDGNVNYGAPQQNTGSYIPPADPAYAPPSRHQMDSHTVV